MIRGFKTVGNVNRLPTVNIFFCVNSCENEVKSYREIHEKRRIFCVLCDCGNL